MQDSLPTITALAEIKPDEFIQGRKTVFRGIGADRVRLFQARATMLKASPPMPYLRAQVSLDVPALELFFDVEVDPLRDICYLHGIIERHQGDNATEQFVAFFAEAPTPAGERDALAVTLDYLAARDQAVIYYYSKYERTTYRKLQQRYPDICTPEDVERCSARCEPLISTAMSSTEQRSGQCETTRSRLSPDILVSTGVIPIPPVPPQSNGSTGGAARVVPKSASASSTIMRTTVGQRESS